MMEKINAVGRRKASVARIYLSEGKGKITVNKKDYKAYFPVVHLVGVLEEPFKVLKKVNQYDVVVNVKGGGIKGQAEAIRLGIVRALLKVDPENRPALKQQGLITRNSKVVERKKAGFRKARKRMQYSKR